MSCLGRRAGAGHKALKGQFNKNIQEPLSTPPVSRWEILAWKGRLVGPTEPLGESNANKIEWWLNMGGDKISRENTGTWIITMIGEDPCSKLIGKGKSENETHWIVDESVAACCTQGHERLQ